MSWLYSLFLAGLAFSSSHNPVNLPAVQNVDNKAIYAVADETDHFDQTYPLTPNGRVSLSNVNGSVTVEAWDRSEVRVEYTKTADSRESLGDVDVKIDSRADAISIETDYDNWKRDKGQSWKFGSRKLDVEFHLMVPRGAMLNEIETVNGSVSVSNFTNFTKISAVNGTVKATNIRGTARLSTVNGEVQADFDRLEQGSRISLDTVNGRVALVIPSDANATVKADSLNGSITNDWNLPVHKGKYVGRDMYGRLGTGEIQIKLSSVNGGLAINRKNDGRSLSPSTNLLPAKGQDDDNDDWDSDMKMDEDVKQQVKEATKVKLKVDSAKISRDVERSVRESQKAAAKAAADVSVEMAKIGPELARATAETARVNTEEIERSVRDAVREQALALRTLNAAFLPGVPRVETKSETFAVKGVPQVNIGGRDCSVRVTGWDRSEVQYRVVQFSNSRNGSLLQVSATHSESTVDINVTQPPPAGPGFTGNREPVRIEVMVPKRSNLKVSADGEVRLEGVSGQLEINAADGAVNVRDSDGKLNVASSDGRIRVIGFRGDVDAQSGDAPISLEGEFASLVAKSGEGAVNVVIPANSSADLESNSDSVVGDGVSLTRLKEGGSKYRVGSGGGARFLINSGGNVTIRSSATLSN